MMSISYAGLAYLDDLPTDVWLARWASGNPDLGPKGGVSLALQVPMHVQAILDRIANGLERGLARIPHKHRIDVVLAGRQARSATKPFRCSGGSQQSLR